MPSRLSWRHVIPGLIAVAVLAGIVVGVMMFAGVGKIRGDTREVRIVTGHARGLIHGSEVWLAGQKIGVVDRMEFLPPSGDSVARLVVISKVQEEAASQIRRNSRVMIRAGGNFVGPIVVWIEPGTPASPPLADTDTLRAQVASELEIAGSRAARAAEEFPALLADARRVVSSVRSPDGVGGAFTAPAKAEARKLLSTLDRIQLGGSEHGGRAALMTNARAALARVDTIRMLIASPTGTLGRFRRDSTLPHTIARVREELAALQARLDSSSGTLDRLGRDSAITRALADARQEMALLFADVKKRPLRYIAF